MRAAVLRNFNRPLELADVPDLLAGPGEVVLRVKAVGLCGTDLKISKGLLGTSLPLIPGHEVAGIVTQVAPGVGAPGVGDHVACYLYRPCGWCPRCRAGRETLCPTSTRLGFERDGGFAEFARVRAEEALPISKALAFPAAAVTMDAVVTAWRALKRRGKVKAGQTVAIVGVGGVGLSAISVARHLGARIAAVDRQEAPLARARQQGADLTTLGEAAERAVVDWSGGGVDAAFEMSGSPHAFALATRLVHPGGRVVTVGYAPGTDYGAESARLVLGELTIVGSRAGTPRDAREALAAVEAGTVLPPPVARIGPLEALNDGYAELSRGDVVGRLVFTP
jgi:D-arabinose 1-dehydrogenase-like Zn-dependent alcohol dehydrogenase